MRVKDAIVDQFRERHGDRRPSVDARAPDVRVNAHLARGRVTLSLDLSGESLHRRGYRADKVQVEAPLKENLAAAVLLFAGWPRLAAAGGSFLDPLCGSGTLPIEAALIAADVAPGPAARRGATASASPRWLGHDADLWGDLVAEARRAASGRAEPPGGSRARLRSAAPTATTRALRRRPRLRRARRPARRRRPSSAPTSRRSPRPRTAACSRPTRRTASGSASRRRPASVYALLGERLRTGFDGWRAAVLTGDPRLLAALGLRRQARDDPVQRRPAGAACPPRGRRRGRRRRSRRGATRRARLAGTAGDTVAAGGRSAEPARSDPAGLLSGGAEQFANRLHKNRAAPGAAAAARGAHLLSRLRRRPARVQPGRRRLRRLGAWCRSTRRRPRSTRRKTSRRLEEALAVDRR